MTFAKTPVILAERENALPMLDSAAAEGFDAGVIFRRRWMCQALADSQPPSLRGMGLAGAPSRLPHLRRGGGRDFYQERCASRGARGDCFRRA